VCRRRNRRHRRRAIRSGAADHKEDGAEELVKLGIELPAEE